MIYRNSYFKKEFRQANEQEIGLRRKLLFAMFIGLISFSVFFVLLTLQKSVLSDVIPEIMQPSFFSTIYLYIHAAVIAATVYFYRYYDYLFFSEIRRNTWYLLIQLHYDPLRMIAMKLVALIGAMGMIYTAGFTLTFLLTVFLKYTLVFGYIPTLYISGLADIVLLAFVSALISLFTKRKENALLLIIGGALFLFMCKSLSGAYGILRNRVLMQDIRNLFDIGRSWYYPIFTIALPAVIIATIFRARRLAGYYWPESSNNDTLAGGVSIVRIGAKPDRRQETLAHFQKRRRILSIAVTTLLAGIVFATLTLNVLIILISTATPGNEITIRGIIPYVFQSDTLQPSIMMNDLAFFRKIDVQYPLSEQQIVLFKDQNVVYVERLTQISQDKFQVDIDYYPPGAQVGAMRKQIQRSAIYGVYSGRSRWLGALILFANSITGRVLFLIIPSIFLFYHRQIAALYRKYREK